MKPSSRSPENMNLLMGLEEGLADQSAGQHLCLQIKFYLYSHTHWFTYHLCLLSLHSSALEELSGFDTDQVSCKAHNMYLLYSPLQKKFVNSWSKAPSRRESKFSSPLGRYIPLGLGGPSQLTNH